MVGIDNDETKIRSVRGAKAPFHEPGLNNLLGKTIKKKILHVTDDVSMVSDTQLTQIAVGTPSLEDGSIDLTYVKKATQELGDAIRAKQTYHVAVVKSTVVPGTTNTIVRPILEQSSGKPIGEKIGLCSNPEFLREGTAVNDSVHPDVVVIGANDAKSAGTLKNLLLGFHGKNRPPMIVTRPETAELVKYASNAFLAARVSCVNTIANIAQAIPDVDVTEVAKAIGHIPRIGALFLEAGPGYGGSCFHKDLQALISFSKERGYDPTLLSAIEETNEYQSDRVAALSEKLVGSLMGKRVAVLGLAFKKGTDDVREAASIRVIDRLRKKGASVVAYDPAAMPNAKKLLGNEVEFAEDERSAIKGADCCVVMTEWDEFKRLRPKDFLREMKTPNIIDARRIFEPSKYEELNYVRMGLGSSK